MNDPKTNNSSPITKENIVLFSFGSLFFISSWFVLVQLLRSSFDIFAKNKIIATMVASFSIHGLYYGFISIAAILFLLKKITLQRWWQILSIQSGFLLCSAFSAFFSLSFIGYLYLILNTIDIVCFITIIVISYYNKGYIKLITIGITSEILGPLNMIASTSLLVGAMQSRPSNTAIILYCAITLIYAFSKACVLTYVFLKLCYMITPKTRWHILVTFPIPLLRYFLFYINLLACIKLLKSMA